MSENPEVDEALLRDRSYSMLKLEGMYESASYLHQRLIDVARDEAQQVWSLLQGQWADDSAPLKEKFDAGEITEKEYHDALFKLQQKLEDGGTEVNAHVAKIFQFLEDIKTRGLINGMVKAEQGASK